MKHLFTLLAIALAAALSASAKTFDWPIDSPAAGARQFTAYHGETVRFNLQFRGAMTNLSPVAIYYQTNGMGKAEWLGPLPGTVFHPTNDCGAASYRFFIRCTDPDGVNYSANGSLRMLDSPGFEPSAVQLPVQTLDFSAVTVLNPPWIESETDPTVPAWAKAENPPTPPAPDYSTGNTQLVATIVATSPAPGNYAAVSNAAMSAAAEISAATNGLARSADVSVAVSAATNDLASAVSSELEEYVKTNHIGSVSITGGFVQGTNCVAYKMSHAEGMGTVAGTSPGTIGVMTRIPAHAEGYQTKALKWGAHAEGLLTTADGPYAHSEGGHTEAHGSESHAEGYYAVANGNRSHAEGISTTASGEGAHAEGRYTIANGDYSHAEGTNTVASGAGAHAEGISTTASGEGAHAEGLGTQATADGAHAEGQSTVASGQYSHAEGQGAQATKSFAHAEGRSTQATKSFAHAEGASTIASGQYSHAEGLGTQATAYSAHAEGQYTVASGHYSHAEGQSTVASGVSSHAEGRETETAGQYSHAEGWQSKTALGATYAYAAGYKAKADHIFSFCWQGWDGVSLPVAYYNSHGPGTFNISPYGGIDGFWIGETNFAQHVRNIAAAGGGAEKHIAMFILPLNFTTNEHYTCIELKATTNNFTSGSQRVRTVFYCHTAALETGDGARAYVESFGDRSFDQRSYVSVADSADPDVLATLPRSPSIVILVDVASCRRTNGAWLSNTNDELIWTYARGTLDGREEDGSGRAMWRPCAPVRWLSQMPRWATE